MNFDDFFSLLRDRRSIRYFDTKPIEKETLERILSAAMLAPSVENTQPWHFHVITNPELKKKMMETSCYGDFVEGAATFIVVTCNKAVKGAMQYTIWNPREMEYSSAVAMYTAMQAATTLGIGSCWVSLHHGPAHNLLKLPDYNVVVGGMMLGYMKDAEKEPSGEHDRKPLQEMITYYA